MTTSKPVSELARKPEDAACNFIQEDWLSADLPWLNGSQRSIAIEILKNRFSEMAALTRKQTIEECAKVVEAKRECQPEIFSDYQEGRDVGLVIASAAIREMEVKA